MLNEKTILIEYENMTLRELSNKYSVSTETIRRILKKHGKKRRKGGLFYRKVFVSQDGELWQCRTCGEIKKEELFTVRKNGRLLSCKECQNKKKRKSNMTAEQWSKMQSRKRLYCYNLSRDEYEIKINKQHNRCAICKNEFNSKRIPYIDHDHNSGNVRGILCKKCNSGIGYFLENTDSLFSAISYLEMYV